MTLSRQIISVGWQLIRSELSDGKSGNISARCPDGLAMLITPSATDYRLITERDLVTVHLASGRAEGPRAPSSEWRMHAAVYQARPDVGAVIHHHGNWASAVAVAQRTIPVLIDEAADIGPIRTAPYAPSASQELADLVAAQLAGRLNAVLLSNHGALAVGVDLSEAWRRAAEVERLAKIYIGAELLGGARPLDDSAVGAMQDFFDTYRKGTYRKSPPEEVEFLVTTPPPTGPVGLHDLVSYGFSAGITFASLMHAMVVQKLGRKTRHGGRAA